jgi:hypothetical protein
MVRRFALALLALLPACNSLGSAGDALPSVGAEIVVEDVTLQIDRATISVLLTPAELRSLLGTQDG